MVHGRHFFNKKYILISRRYQLHLAFATRSSLVAIQMHTTKKVEELKKSLYYIDQFLVAAALTPPRQY
jgi:hypothetical protein